MPADKSIGSDKNNLGIAEDDSLLRKLCLEFAKIYDYVIIDAPPNFEIIYARQALNAADCLLPIGLWGDKNSLVNYCYFICETLPTIRDGRQDGGSENLGLWLNRFQSNSTFKNMTIKVIEEYLEEVGENYKKDELSRAFFTLRGTRDLRFIKEETYIKKAIFENSLVKVFRIPWLKRPQEAYRSLLQSIVEEVQ